MCEHCKLTCGASCACGVVRQPPTGFVRTSQKSFAVSAGRGHMECPHTVLDSAGAAGDHRSPLRGVFPCVCTSSVVGGCCLRQLMPARLYGISLGLGRVRPKLRVCCFPRLPRPLAPLQTSPDGAEFAQNRRTSPRKAYFIRRGAISAIENGKIKETRHKPGFFLRHFQDSTISESFTNFPETRSPKNLYFRFRSARTMPVKITV